MPTATGPRRLRRTAWYSDAITIVAHNQQTGEIVMGPQSRIIQDYVSLWAALGHSCSIARARDDGGWPEFRKVML